MYPFLEGKSGLWNAELALLYIEKGFIHLDRSWAKGGLVLLHPSILEIEGEVAETIPIALEYALRGHLIVLLEPMRDENGRGITSPDGFLDIEAQVIEFKNVTKVKEYTFDNQLKDAGKKGKAMIRSLRVPAAASPEFLARRLNGRYNATIQMDRVDLLYRNQLIRINRALWHNQGYAGLLEAIKKGESSFEHLA